MYLSNGNSSLARFVMMSTPLIYVDLSDVIKWCKLYQDICSNGKIPKALDSHPKAQEVVAHPVATPLNVGETPSLVWLVGLHYPRDRPN